MHKKIFFILVFFCMSTGIFKITFAQNRIKIDIEKKKIEFIEPKNKNQLDVKSKDTIIEIINFVPRKNIRLQLKDQHGKIVYDESWPKELLEEETIEFTIKKGGLIEGESIQQLSSPFELLVIIDESQSWLKESEIGITQSAGRDANQKETGREFFKSNYGNQIKDPYIKDTVYLFFDAEGKQVGRTPKNVDQDDEFIIIIATRNSNSHKYDIKIEEGEYAPSDLVLRPTADLGSESRKSLTDDPWEPRCFHFGPFTTERFRFTITYDDKQKNKQINLNTYSIRINKLYHAGFGISFLQTRLEDPSFDIAPLDDTTNTIIALDKGDRSMVSVNVIWYWRVFHKDFWTGSGLTKGRDVLKEERFYEKIFPTFGISLDGNYKENFFFGLVYEFARGANFTLGLHYGKVKRLAYEDFEIGKDIFEGTKEDILITNKFETALFIGLSIDTRIFKAIFGFRE